MSEQIDKVLVIWADADGHRHLIGDLWREGEEFVFAYRRDALERAMPLGFHLLAEFPTARGPDAPYRAPILFPTFKQRIPQRGRADYEDMMRGWGVETEDPFEILVKSGGILHTDSLEFAEARPDDDDLSRPLNFRLAGRRFANDTVEPAPGQPLRLERILPIPRPPSDHRPNARRAADRMGAHALHRAHRAAPRARRPPQGHGRAEAPPSGA